MIHNVFSVRDQAADAYLPPFVLPRIEMAKRVFAQAVNSESHQFGQAPADYTLFCLGTFDDETGKFLIQPAQESLGNGLIYKESQTHAEKANGQTPAVSNDASIQPGTESGDSAE